MAIGVIELLFIIFIAGGGLGMFALAAFAAIKGRPGIAALIVGAGLFTALVGVGIVTMVWSFQPRVVPGLVESAHIAPDGTQYWLDEGVSQPDVVQLQGTPDGKQFWPSDQTFVPPVNVGRTTWSFSLRPALFIGLGVIALLFVVARRGLAHSACGGHRRIWPAFVALPILAVLVIGGVRYEASSTGGAAARQAAEMRESMHRQQQAFQRTFDEQRRKAHQQVAAAKAKVHQQIEQMDIHELMERFDAPRIVLQAPMPSLGPTSGSATFLIAAASTAAESAKKEAQGKAEKAKSEADVDADKQGTGTTAQEEHASAMSDSVTTHKEDAKPEANMEAKAAAIVEAEAPTPPVAPVPPTPPVAAKAVLERSVEKTPADGVAKPAAVELDVVAATPPKWINDPPKRTGDVRREVIVTEEYHSAEECYAAADIYLMFKALERLQQLRGQANAASELPSVTFAKGGVLVDGKLIAVDQFPGTWQDWRLLPLSNMGITPEYLRREIVAKDPGNNESREYLETVTRSFGPMRKLYLQVEFTPAVDRELLRRSEAYQRQERFAVVGVGAGVVLTLLTGVWGLLKIDTVTKGYYTKRLFLGVPAAIIAGIIAVIAWMSFTL